MNRYKKLCSDTVILALGTFGSKLLVFLLMPLYTALLSPSEYSTAELISSTANLIMPFACMGITTGIFRFAAEKGSNKQEVFSSSMALLAMGLGALLTVGIPVFLVGTLKIETLLVVLYVLMADLQAVCAQYVRATDRPKLFALQGIFNTLTTILFNLLFLLVFDLGVTGYVLSVIMGNFVTTCLLVVFAKLWRVLRFSCVKGAVIKELFRFSLPLVPTTICWLITDLSDRYFVTAICGADINGIYSAAYKLPTVVTLLSGIFMQAWQFSAVTEAADEEECGRFYSKVFRGFLSLIFIGAATLILLSKPLCRVLLNQAYFEAWRYMPTLLCAAAIEAVVSFLATVYLVKKKSMHSFLTAVAGTLLNVILNAVFIPHWNAFGAAIATFLGYFLVYVLRTADAPRLIRFRLYLPRQVANLLLLLLIAAVVTLQIRGWIWIGCVLAAGVWALNFPTLWNTAKGLLRQRRTKIL